MGKISLFLLIASIGLPHLGLADYTADEYIREGNKQSKRKQHFQAARYFFQASQSADNPQKEAEIAAMLSNELIAQGLHQSASYFFLKAIGSGDDKATQMALQGTGALIQNVGGVIFKKYLLKYTRPEQYTPMQRNFYLYFQAQDQLFAQQHQGTVNAVNGISNNFERYPEALHLRGTAFLSLNQIDLGIDDFKKCAVAAEQPAFTKHQSKDETREIKNRCLAGVARGLYQAKKYQEADEWYEKIEIQSFVWPQIQYERAWSAVARGDYNRALGRLVTYKSPALSWYHDSEVDVLRSLSYLQLCIYDEVEKETGLFTTKFGGLGDELKKILESGSSGSTRSLVSYFQLGRRALDKKIFSDKPIDQVMNRFVRSPHFIQLANTGQRVRRELNFLNSQGNAGKRGLGGFLRDTLSWRWQTAQEVGGAFVRDRLSTEYQAILNNVRTMDIVRLEMLRRAKTQLEKGGQNDTTDVWGDKKRGSLGRPATRDNQYFWDFNGEFWADELGDYVFSLRPECN